MSVEVAKTKQKLILQDLARLKSRVALHPSAYVRIVVPPKLREIERLLET